MPRSASNMPSTALPALVSLWASAASARDSCASALRSVASALVRRRSRRLRAARFARVVARLGFRARCSAWSAVRSPRLRCLGLGCRLLGDSPLVGGLVPLPASERSEGQSGGEGNRATSGPSACWLQRRPAPACSAVPFLRRDARWSWLFSSSYHRRSRRGRCISRCPRRWDHVTVACVEGLDLLRAVAPPGANRYLGISLPPPQCLIWARMRLRVRRTSRLAAIQLRNVRQLRIRASWLTSARRSPQAVVPPRDQEADGGVAELA